MPDGPGPARVRPGRVGTDAGGQTVATLTVTALIGAALAGAGGARVVSSEIDKRFLRVAATGAAAKPDDRQLAATLATASPAAAARAVQP